MSKRSFSEKELKYYYCAPVYEESLGNGRWNENLSTVFEADDGKLYRGSWGRGLTELQEDEFYECELEEVFLSTKVKAKIKKIYLTSEELEKSQEFLINKENVVASALISDGADEAIEALKSFDSVSVGNFLNIISPAILDRESLAFLEAAKQFFNAIESLKGEL